MKSFFLLILLGLVSLSANAQTAKELPEAVATSIPYKRSIPPSIRSHARKPFASRFFGTSRASSRGELAFHLFEPGNKNGENGSGNASQSFQLDVFERLRGQNQWRLLNSVPVRYQSHEGAQPVRFGASFLWLDERNKSVPLLQLNCYGEGMYGDFGDHVLVVFPGGWKKSANVQAFGYGADQSSDNYGQGARFERDVKGVFQVRMAYSSNQISHFEVWRWNGLQFAATKTSLPIKEEGGALP